MRLAGEIILSFCSLEAYSKNPYLAEAQALRKDMLICYDLGLNQIEFEGDCQYIIHTVKAGEVDSIVLRPILFDFLTLLQHHPSWKLQFV